MANCPVCKSEIEDDFGLVTCPSCGSQVLLEIDGCTAVPAAVLSPEAESEFAPPPPALVDANNDEISQLFTSQLTEEVEQELYSNEATGSEPASPDMSEIADYANSEISQGREGFLRYNIFVSGIDTSDIRDLVREAINDSRFLWDADQVLNEIENGNLVFHELTAVKSTVLVQKLRSISVDIRWEQYAIHQS